VRFLVELENRKAAVWTLSQQRWTVGFQICSFPPAKQYATLYNGPLATASQIGHTWPRIRKAYLPLVFWFSRCQPCVYLFIASSQNRLIAETRGYRVGHKVGS